MNDYLKRTHAEAKQVARELDVFTETPEAVNRKLRQVYAELPEEVPSKKRMGKGLRGVFGSLGSVAAAFLLLFGINAVNPAFAESIPVVGHVFQAVNQRAFEPVNPVVQNLAVPVEHVGEEVPAGGPGETAMAVSMQEFYYDGEYVYAGTVIECQSDADTLIAMGDGAFNVTINGEAQIDWSENGPENQEGFEFLEGNLFWYRDEAMRYVCSLAFRVPEQYRTGKPLEIGLSFAGIHDLSDFNTVNSTPFTLSFTAEQNEAERLSVLTEGVEENGIRLVSATSTPGGTEIVVEYPDTYQNPSRGARLLDGHNIGGGAGGREDLGNGTIRMTAIFYGRKSGTEQPVVYTVYGKNGDEDILAEFTLDFQNHTAEATRHYADPESPHYYGEDGAEKRSPEYACGEEKVLNLEEGYLLTRIFVADGKATTLVFASPEAYREVRAELYQNGEQVGSVVSEQNQGTFSPNYIYWDYEGPDGDNVVPTDLNEYFLHLRTSDFMVGDELEVRLYDNKSGELLTQQQVTLQNLK